jgi:hypothetical protein
MRNPFRRRRRIPGAAADWDESKHVPLGDDQVLVPADQVNPEAVERLSGVHIGHGPDGSPCVLVDVLAAKAEAQALALRASRDLGRFLSAKEEQGYAFQALNNQEHWLFESDMDTDDETEYTLLKINLMSGRIEDPS